MSSPSEALQTALQCLKQGRYREAIQILEPLSQDSSTATSQDYLQAQIYLIRAYQQSGQRDRALSLCQKLVVSEHPQVRDWAQQTLRRFKTSQASQDIEDSPPAIHPVEQALASPTRLALAGVSGNLVLASGITLSLLFGMVLVLGLALVLIVGSSNPGTGFLVAVGITLVFNTLAFFVSPLFMDLTQRWLYKTRWVSLAEIQQLSPKAAAVIREVCAQRQLQEPRLGIIDDQNPTAFTYGSLPNQARLVVSQGLFTYLDDEEVATVYAHELGHIVHWDFAVMTLGSTLVQITYLVYSVARRLGQGKSGKAKDAAGTAAMVAYGFYIVGTYLLMYLSRTREYFADHFAAETTGNPNALARALVKIAYGILEERERTQEPSRLVEGTRALGIYDPKAAASTGTVYRITSEPHKIGRVFLWDLFNPWAKLMELNSTHPLTGKRVRALSTYAEQLGQPTEFNMAQVVAETKGLSKEKLYGGFVLDLLFYTADFLGLWIGILVGFALTPLTLSGSLLTFGLMGFGAGTLIKALVMFPAFAQAPASDVLTLMSDPYASPLRGQPVRLKGNLIGRGDAGYQFGSDLKLQDRSGLMFVRYASRFGPLGNALFGMKQVKALLGEEVVTLGWFRRGIMPWVDLIRLQTPNGRTVNSYHRFWAFVLGTGAIAIGYYFLVS